MKRYLVVIEQAEGNLAAFVPDVDGCVATGGTVEEVLALMKEALTDHLAVMAEEGYEIPEPSSIESAYVEVEAPRRARKAKAKSA